MKKTLAASAVALAVALALTGCSGSGSGAKPSPTASATPISSYTQIHSLADAVAWSITMSPSTPDLATEIPGTAAKFEQYVKSSSKLTTAQKSAMTSELEQIQQEAKAGSKTTAEMGAELQQVGQQAFGILTPGSNG